MSSTRLNPTWYGYQLQVYRDVPSHFANEVPVSAKNRHSHPFVVLPHLPFSHPQPRVAMSLHVSAFTSCLKTSILSMLKECASPSNDTTHVVLTKVCSSFSSLPSRLASRSLVQQQASHRKISELCHTIQRSESILAFPPHFLLDGVATTWANKLSTRLC